MKSKNNKLNIKKIFKITSTFWCMSSFFLRLWLLISGLFILGELLKNIHFFSGGIEKNEIYLLYGEIISGLLMLTGMCIPIVIEKRFLKQNSFYEFLSRLKSVEILDYYEYISFLHILQNYITADENEFCWLEEKICGQYSWKNGEMVYGIIRKYYNPMDANRILSFIKSMDVIDASSNPALFEEAFNKSFEMQLTYKTYKYKFLGLYVDRTRRIIETGFLFLLILSFISDNSIDMTIILNALAIFLLVWDLCGVIKT